MIVGKMSDFKSNADVQLYACWAVLELLSGDSGERREKRKEGRGEDEERRERGEREREEEETRRRRRRCIAGNAKPGEV